MFVCVCVFVRVYFNVILCICRNNELVFFCVGVCVCACVCVCLCVCVGVSLFPCDCVYMLV